MRNIRDEVVKGMRVIVPLLVVAMTGAGAASADDVELSDSLAGEQLARVTYGSTAAPQPIEIAPLVPKIKATEDEAGHGRMASIKEIADRMNAAADAEPVAVTAAAEPAVAVEPAAEAVESDESDDAAAFAETQPQLSFTAHEADEGYFGDAAPMLLAKLETVEVEAAGSAKKADVVASAEPKKNGFWSRFRRGSSDDVESPEADSADEVEAAEAVEAVSSQDSAEPAIEVLKLAAATTAPVASKAVTAPAVTSDPSEAVADVDDHEPVAELEPVAKAEPVAEREQKKGFWNRFRRDSSEKSESPKVEASGFDGSAEPVRIARPASVTKSVPQVETKAAPTPAPLPVIEVRPAPKAAPAPVAVAQADAEVARAETFAGTDTQTFGGVTQNPASELGRSGGHGRGNIMRVLTGKSIIIDLKNDAKRVSVANPEVAEVMIISPRQVMVNGLAEGETSIIIWDRRGNYTMYTLVSGETLQQQVMLEVTVAEINRTAMERHGLDFRSFGGQFGVVSNYGDGAPLGGQFPASEGDPLFPFGLDGGISWAIVDTKNNIAALFQQIQDENLGRILAEPKLLTRSGKEANFLSGGEIPIVVTQNDDTTIEFKEFGTRIDFVPRVREDGQIDLQLASEVSEPDFSAGVELFGFTVPAFVTRRVDTDVSLEHGESLIIAGLIKETKQELETKMPFIGDIPFLGYFFRTTEYQNEVLELIMVVKPMLVDPVERGTRVALPTDRGPLTRDEVKTQSTDEKVSRPRPW